MTVRYVTLSTPGGPVLAWSNEAWAQVADHYAGVKLPYSKKSVRRDEGAVASCGPRPGSRPRRLPHHGSSARTGFSQDGAS